jgi:lipoate-protein ligase A
MTDPAINLALEEYCFRQLDPRHDYLLFYVNEPAIIIGAHQNPWEQIDAAYIKKEGIPLIRRISGGGAVYHDRGNINVCFMTPHRRETFGHFELFTQPIIDTLNRLGIPAVHAHQNTIQVKGKKISGYAQFANMKRMFSHGTLLFSAQLDVLARALNSKFTPLSTKAIRSVKRDVANISDFLKTPMSIEPFMEILFKDISTVYGNPKKYELSPEAWSDIYQLANEKYKTWAWVYGHSPKFTVKEQRQHDGKILTVLICVDKGIIERIECEANRLEALRLSNQWVGKRFLPGAVKKGLKPYP